MHVIQMKIQPEKNQIDSSIDFIQFYMFLKLIVNTRASKPHLSALWSVITWVEFRVINDDML